MTLFSISEAARLTGKSRKTLCRYIADGRLSVSELDSGKKTLDSTLLLEVFGVASGPGAGSCKTLETTSAATVLPVSARVSKMTKAASSSPDIAKGEDLHSVRWFASRDKNIVE
jgi:hypothetical protein